MSRPSRTPDPADLAASEFEVLKVLWERAPATVREVRERLAELGRDLAYTTVQTFLTRLEQKGFVERRREGLANAFTPLVTRDLVEQSRVKTLLDDLYDGASAPLVLRLMSEGRFTTEEIDALHELVDELDRTAKPARPAKKKSGDPTRDRSRRGRGGTR